MKKVYERPGIFFENFSLNTNIAADCSIIHGSPSRNICGIEGTGDIMLFSVGLSSNCMYYPDGYNPETDDINNGLCYHVPGDTNRLFNS